MVDVPFLSICLGGGSFVTPPLLDNISVAADAMLDTQRIETPHAIRFRDLLPPWAATLLIL
uniref:hypothetical protein n=1 Tax=Edaphosphingomonas laterariae TaxID=861865 RepID=UPI001C527FCC|nr:hypothetical protein [Sphingomonas laterariae]